MADSTDGRETGIRIKGSNESTNDVLWQGGRQSQGSTDGSVFLSRYEKPREILILPDNADRYDNY